MHATPEDCLDYSPPWGVSNSVYECKRRGYDVVPAMEERDLCYAARYQAYADCVTATAACDFDAFDECYEEHVAVGTSCTPTLTSDEQRLYQTALLDCVVGAARGCRDGNEATGTGDAVFSGTTIGAGNDVGEGGPDVAHIWTAPNSGPYVLDVHGSEFQATILVLDSCEDENVLASSSPNDVGHTAPLEFVAEAGTRYIIAIDSDTWEDAGRYVVSIR